jgi:radical SAM protein with 4Fe4S-binding SPASM domain
VGRNTRRQGHAAHGQAFAIDETVTATISTTAERDRGEHERACRLLREGRIQQGAHLLGALAQTTQDDELRSQCVFNLGEVLEKLGQRQEAYDNWYKQAHKPRHERRTFDIAARLRVMRMVEQHGLTLRPPDFPPRVQVELTNRCNLRCIMCTRNQMTRGEGDIDFETFRKIADEWAVEPGVALCLYFLGEPLLHRGLESMIAYLVALKKQHPGPGQFGIQTNGMLLTRERAAALLDAGLRNFAISLDALEGDLERIRRGASYRRIERNILDLIDLGRERKIKDLAVEISKLTDDPASEETQRFCQVWQPRVRQVYLAGISKSAGNAYMDAAGTIRSIDQTPQSARPHYCGQGNRLVIHWNGDMCFCCSDINGDLKVGNIHQSTIREAWHSPAIERIRSKIFAADYAGLTACETCSAGGVQKPESG